MVTVECSRCGAQGEVHGRGLYFCGRCKLMIGVERPEPMGLSWWRREAWRWAVAVVVVGVAVYLGYGDSGLSG